MARHLLDSDVLIWILRGKKEAVDFVKYLIQEEVPAISSLAFYEIWAGARTGEEATITEFLSAFEVFPVDADVAKQGGEYFRAYRKRGITFSMADALIAATAKIHGLVIVTQNIRHFAMIDIEKRSL